MSAVREAHNAREARGVREARRIVQWLLEERECVRCGTRFNELENVGAWECSVPAEVPLDPRERARRVPCDHVEWERVYGDGVGGHKVARVFDPLAAFAVPPDAASVRAPNEPDLCVPAAKAQAFFTEERIAGAPGWRHDADLDVYVVSRRCAPLSGAARRNK